MNERDENTDRPAADVAYVLYVKPGCPYCERVQTAMNDMGIERDERKINASDRYESELLAKGGKKQVPFLVVKDDETGETIESMYESADIVEYLTEHHGS